MHPFYRWLAFGGIAVQVATSGCAFGRKPYANDPLIKKSRAVWGDREKALQGEIPDSPEPVIPPPPKTPRIGEID